MELLQHIEEENHIWSIEYSPKSNRIYTSSTTPYVQIYELKDSKLTLQKPLLTPHTRTIRKLRCNQNGTLACCSFDATISLWEDESLKTLATLEGHESEVKCADWNKSGSLLATCSRDKSVWLWKSYTGSDFECASVLTGHTGDVKCVAFYHNGTTLFSGSFDGTIRVWKCSEETEWEESQIYNNDSITIWDIKPYKTFVVAVCAKGRIILFDYVSEKLELVDKIDNESFRDVYSVDIIDGKVAVGCGDNGVRLYKINEQTKKLILIAEQQQAHDNDVNAVRFIDRNILMSGGDDNQLRVWRYAH
ncbi:protein CIAO1, putative [Entamoeba invadens IP1]|uniref:Protein CIAO1, putative n=1 Tax=Entamoeba invadens IP1 TaxID=370355 RepID=A0A0A1U1X1_ENTIV|nr:protein CIAO1, putative [Entamoeba invadens IP1]ELP88041.1 protein CIAO1, putative [Entamoeba invadens IP1]|eukprot:XP_004254812.1 protein CIAO1, putative [Entamoeba invadens IP1]